MDASGHIDCVLYQSIWEKQSFGATGNDLGGGELSFASAKVDVLAIYCTFAVEGGGLALGSSPVLLKELVVVI